MNTTIEFELTNKLLSRAVFYWEWRYWEWVRLIFIPLIVLPIVMLIVYGMYWHMAALSAIVLAVLYLHIRPICGRLKKIQSLWSGLPNRQVTCHISEDSLVHESALGRFEYTWKQAVGAMRSRWLWMILLPDSGYIILPNKLVDNELEGFITRKIRENGGKVR